MRRMVVRERRETMETKMNPKSEKISGESTKTRVDSVLKIKALMTKTLRMALRLSMTAIRKDDNKESRPGPWTKMASSRETKPLKPQQSREVAPSAISAETAIENISEANSFQPQHPNQYSLHS